MSAPAVLTKEVFAEAFGSAAPRLEALMKAEEGVRGTILALPPCLVEPKYLKRSDLASEAYIEAEDPFVQLILGVGFMYDFGGTSTEHPYDRVATAKLFGCYVYQDEGYSSRYIRSHPWLLRAGMSKWAGGINDEGILVAYSGQPEDLDELVAKVFSSEIKAGCRELFQDAFEGLPGVLTTPLPLAA